LDVLSADSELLECDPPLREAVRDLPHDPLPAEFEPVWPSDDVAPAGRPVRLVTLAGRLAESARGGGEFDDVLSAAVMGAARELSADPASDCATALGWLAVPAARELLITEPVGAPSEEVRVWAIVVVGETVDPRLLATGPITVRVTDCRVLEAAPSAPVEAWAV
jgi:hypothetical protein